MANYPQHRLSSRSQNQLLLALLLRYLVVDQDAPNLLMAATF